MKLRDLIRDTARRLSRAKLHYGHGTDNARDEAAFLVLRGLGLAFDADLEQEVDPRHVEVLVRKRIEQRIPAAYLLNEAWLAGVPFHVDRRVIVPRSHIAFLLRELSVAPRSILDLCTGSGCLAILAARAFPRARVDASDISAAALEVAARNVRRHRLGSRIRLLRSDLFTNLKGRYDLILANPPYVDLPSMRELPPEYRYEPAIALAGGRGGLDYVKAILEAAPQHLAPEGVLVCEVGDGKAALERACPRTAFVWPLPQVFRLTAARMAGVSRNRTRPLRAK